MHELSVCQALLTQVERVAHANGASRVVSVSLRIGPLSGVEPDLLQQAYPLVRAGTLAAESELIIERLPIRVSCDRCGAETEAQANALICGRCGDWHTQLLSGDEMLLVSVELIQEEVPTADKGRH